MIGLCIACGCAPSGRPARQRTLALAPSPAVVAAPGLQIGQLAYVTERSEGRWASWVDEPPHQATPGLVVFDRGAARVLVRNEGDLSLLEIYPIGAGQRGLAWLPTRVLSAVPVALAPYAPEGELAWLPALPIETESPVAGQPASFTACGLHEIRKFDQERSPRTRVAQYDSGVEVHGWLRWRLPRVVARGCRPEIVLREKPDQPLPTNLVVLDQVDLEQELLALFAQEPVVHIPLADGFGVTCVARRVKKLAASGFELVSDPYLPEKKGSWRPRCVILPADGDSFRTRFWLEGGEPGAMVPRFLCPPVFEITAITDREIRGAILSNHCTERPQPYALSESAMRGWYRSQEACNAAIAPLAALLADPTSDPSAARDAHVLEPLGCP